MTDNQLREFFDKLTECVNGIQILQDGQVKLETGFAEMKSDIVEIKSDVAEMKAGQKRLELGQETTNRSFDVLAGESIRVKSRVEILEKRIN
jgi:hypothetical protein